MAAYAGYGGSPAPYPAQAPNAYGQPQVPSAVKKHGKDMAGEEEENEDGYRCGGSNSPSARLDNWCIFLCCFGGFLCMVATFIPTWRVDSHGTTELEKHFSFKGFPSRSYGVIHVKGSWSQSWTTLAQSSCDVRNLGQLSGLASAALSLVQDGDCAGSESCQQGFSSSMFMRCQEYQTMMRISMVTLTGTFIAVVMVICATLVISMSKRKKSGGIAFGMYMFAGLLCCITGSTWAAVSDNSFKNMSLAAWYPYPSLSVGYYLHVTGFSLILIFDTIFGFIVLPQVWKYDPAEEKLNKKKAKLAKRQDREQQYAAKKQELKAIIAGQQQGATPGNFPPPPGYGPQDSPWAQQNPAPQQVYGGYTEQPAQLGFAQVAEGQTWGQGGAVPAPNPMDFGLSAAAPMQQQGGYGPEAGYCAPPAGGWGEGPAGGYSAGPAGGYGAAPGPGGQYGAQPQQDAKAAYQWPAFSGAEDGPPAYG